MGVIGEDMRACDVNKSMVKIMGRRERIRIADITYVEWRPR